MRLVISFVAVLLSSHAFAQDARTTRIEPNATYGATVTMEEGVRVFRPLPSEAHVIVNPNNTPLGLNYYQLPNGTYVPVPAARHR